MELNRRLPVSGLLLVVCCSCISWLISRSTVQNRDKILVYGTPLKPVAMCLTGQARTFAAGGYRQLNWNAVKNDTREAFAEAFNMTRRVPYVDILEFLDAIGREYVDVYALMDCDTEYLEQVHAALRTLHPVVTLFNTRTPLPPLNCTDKRSISFENMPVAQRIPADQFYYHELCLQAISERERMYNVRHEWLLRLRPDAAPSAMFPSFPLWNHTFLADVFYVPEGPARTKICPSDISALSDRKVGEEAFRAYSQFRRCHQAEYLAGLFKPYPECVLGDHLLARGITAVLSPLLVSELQLIRNCSAASPRWMCDRMNVTNLPYWT